MISMGKTTFSCRSCGAVTVLENTDLETMTGFRCANCGAAMDQAEFVRTKVAYYLKVLELLPDQRHDSRFPKMFHVIMNFHPHQVHDEQKHEESDVQGGVYIVNDDRILAALLSTNSVAEAAKQCKVAKSTVYSRLNDPEFSAKYDAAIRDVVKGVKTALQTKMGTAVDTMAEIMVTTGNSPQVRLNAADAVLRHGLRLTEQIDILERVDALEKMLLSKEGTE